MENINIDDIKVFLKHKNIVWDGLIYDLAIDKLRTATIDYFDNERQVRLWVHKPNSENYYIKRIIVTEKDFLIENTQLQKLDNYERFSKEWRAFIKSKKYAPIKKIKKITKDIFNLPPNSEIDFDKYFFFYHIEEEMKMKYFKAVLKELKPYIKIKVYQNRTYNSPYELTFIRNDITQPIKVLPTNKDAKANKKPKPDKTQETNTSTKSEEVHKTNTNSKPNKESKMNTNLKSEEDIEINTNSKPNKDCKSNKELKESSTSIDIN